MNGDERRKRQMALGVSIFTAAATVSVAAVLGVLVHEQGHHPAAAAGAALGVLGAGIAGVAWMHSRSTGARIAFTAGMISAAVAVAVTRIS